MAIPYFERIGAILVSQVKLKGKNKLVLKDLYDLLSAIHHNKGNNEKSTVCADKLTNTEEVHSYALYKYVRLPVSNNLKKDSFRAVFFLWDFSRVGIITSSRLFFSIPIYPRTDPVYVHCR